MTTINQLSIKNFRNIGSAKLQFAEKINLITGDNGSGKSSLLEAIYSLASGRSFRGNINHAINFQAIEYAINATLDNNTWHIGATRHKTGASYYKLQHDSAKIIEIAQILPLQFINVHAEELLHGEVKLRQRYLDWLLFHVEPTFSCQWKSFNKCLQQRNMLLKQIPAHPYLKGELAAWDLEFVTLSNTINTLRTKMLQRLTPTIECCLKEYFNIEHITLEYYQGWQGEDLLTMLHKACMLELATGFTANGPHKADLLIKYQGHSAKHVLSRGQQKLLSMCFFLARARWLRDNANILGIFLIDDFGAELDFRATNVLVSALEALENQVIATSLTPCACLRSARMFHVEHGVFNYNLAGITNDVFA